MKRILPILTAALLASGAAYAQSSQPMSSGQTTAPGRSTASAGTAAPSTEAFVKDASAGSQFEIQSGQIAEQQGQNKQIKAFGARMVKDHGKAAKDLEAALKSDKDKSLQPATELTPDQQQKLSQLKQANGADFDKLYAQTMVEDHHEDVDKFQAYAGVGDDPKVKAFAKKTLNVIKMHLAMITKINAKLNKTAMN